MYKALPGRVSRGQATGAGFAPLAFVLAIAAVGFGIQSLRSVRSPGTGLAVETSHSTPVAEIAAVETDLWLHLTHLQEKLERAAVKCREGQDLIRQVSENLDREYLQLQTRRLWAADSRIEYARKEIEQAIEESELLSSHLGKEKP